MRKLILARGGESEIFGFISLKDIRTLINAELLDFFMLRDGIHICAVDDMGHKKGLPLNAEATALYWDKCGAPNDHVIRGDVVIVPDEDYA
jgi:hypothetical protein